MRIPRKLKKRIQKEKRRYAVKLANWFYESTGIRPPKLEKYLIYLVNRETKTKIMNAYRYMRVRP